MLMTDKWTAARNKARAKKIKREEKAKSLWKPRVKRKKLPSIKKLRAMTWAALRAYVLRRDTLENDGLCMICHTNPIELLYHLLPASSGSAAKYDPANTVGACNTCNYLEFRNRAKYVFIHIGLFGLEYMTALDVKSRTVVQYRRPDYEAMILDFTSRLIALESEPFSNK